MSLKTGKLPAVELAALLAALPQRDSRVLVGPRPGEDAAVMDFGDRVLVATTDPVTFTTDRIGWYAVHINANDVAVTGARPRWFFAVLLLPADHTSPATVTDIMGDIVATCDQLQVTVCGGHTEVTAGIDRPIVIGQMLGEADRSRLVCKDGLKPGDLVVLTQAVAIEGTAILARERKRWLDGRVDPDVIARAARLLFEPGISVVAAALTASDAGEVHAMHDPTEGGLQTGLAELAAASGMGLEVFADRVPILPETRVISDALGIDPLRLLASGALLIGAPPHAAEPIIRGLTARRIPATVIAEVRQPEFGTVISGPAGRRALTSADRDELARILESQD